MKFTSAPKKMLLTGLSAAMVVAFAPAVAAPLAQAKTGDAAAVTLDAQGGTVAGATSFATATEGLKITLPNATSAQGYALAGWYYDADNDGVRDTDEPLIPAGEYTVGTQLKGIDAPTATSKAIGSYTLKAEYKAPSVNAVTFDRTGDLSGVGNTDTTTDRAAFVVSYSEFAETNVKKGATYTLSIKKGGADGNVLASKTFAPNAKSVGNTTQTNDIATAAAGTYTLHFRDNVLNGQADQDNAYQQTSVLTSGKYTIEISDGTNVVSMKTIDVVKLTLSYKQGTETKTAVFFYNKQAGFDFPEGYDASKFVDADGFVPDTKTLTGDVTLTEQTATQSVADSEYNEAGRAISFKVTDTAGKKDDSYATTVYAPDGKTVVWAGTDKLAADNDAVSFPYAFSFDQASTQYQHAQNSATETAGDYVVEVVKTAADGTKTTAKKKISLTQVKFEAGTGTKLVKGTKDYFTSDEKLPVDYASKFELSDANDYEAPITVKLNGKDATQANYGAGKVNTFTATAKAMDKSNQVAAPALASATRALKANTTGTYVYTVKVTEPTAGATVTAKQGSEDLKGSLANGWTTENFTDDIVVTAAPTAGVTDPKLTTPETLTLHPNAAIAAFASDTTGANAAATLQTYVGKSTSTKWLAEANTAKAISDGAAAIEGLGWFYGNTKSDQAIVLAQYKALYEAVAKDAAAELAPYADQALVTVGDKAYTIDQATYKTAQDSIDKAAKEVKAAVDAENVTNSTYVTAINEVVTAANTGLNAAKPSTITAADIEAAAAVDKTASALEAVTDDNYEAVYAAAQKAFADYNGLTAAQKPLVKTESVSAIAKALDGSAAKYQAAAKAAKEKADQDTKAAQDAQAKAESKAAEAQKAADAASAQLKAAQKTVSGVKVKTAKEKATVSWKKAKGYKFQVSYQQAGKKAKTEKTSKAKLTVKELKGGQYYTFQVRTYKKASGKTIYGQWSTAVSKKVK